MAFILLAIIAGILGAIDEYRQVDNRSRFTAWSNIKDGAMCLFVYLAIASGAALLMMVVTHNTIFAQMDIWKAKVIQEEPIYSIRDANGVHGSMFVIQSGTDYSYYVKQENGSLINKRISALKVPIFEGNYAPKIQTIKFVTDNKWAFWFGNVEMFNPQSKIYVPTGTVRTEFSL